MFIGSGSEGPAVSFALAFGLWAVFEVFLLIRGYTGDNKKEQQQVQKKKRSFATALDDNSGIVGCEPRKSLGGEENLATIYTIGHSTRQLPGFLELLTAHHIKTLVDIRSLPGSRRLPHFNSDLLADALAKSGMEYVWEKDLGGRRKKQNLSPDLLRLLGSQGAPNAALRSDSFRNYADYMLTATFQQGVERLIQLAEKSATSIMCAEAVYFRCHRMLVSDYLVAHGCTVLHITGVSEAKPHQLMAEARLVGETLVYPALIA